jgi:hypothetical protein
MLAARLQLCTQYAKSVAAVPVTCPHPAPCIVQNSLRYPTGHLGPGGLLSVDAGLLTHSGKDDDV